MNPNPSLEALQPAIFYKLCGEPNFANITIFKVREADITSQLEQSLSGIGLAAGSGLPASVAKSGSPGLTVEILMPMIGRLESRNLPGPPVFANIKIQVKENHDICFGPGGLDQSAETIAQLILQTLHQWQSTALGISLYPTDEGITPNRDYHPFVTYDLNLTTLMPFNPLPKCGTPTESDHLLTVTLTAANGGDSIYYTTDGTFPSPQNATATLYTVPFLVTSGTLVTFAAYQAGFTGSDCLQYTIN